MPTVQSQFRVKGAVPLSVRVTPAREQNWWVAIVGVGLAAVLGFGWLIATHVTDSSATKTAIAAALDAKAAADAKIAEAAEKERQRLRDEAAQVQRAADAAATRAAEEIRQRDAALRRAADEAAAQERQRLREEAAVREAAARQQQAAAQAATARPPQIQVLGQSIQGWGPQARTGRKCSPRGAIYDCSTSITGKCICQ